MKIQTEDGDSFVLFENLYEADCWSRTYAALLPEVLKRPKDPGVLVSEAVVDAVATAQSLADISVAAFRKRAANLTLSTVAYEGTPVTTDQLLIHSEDLTRLKDVGSVTRPYDESRMKLGLCQECGEAEFHLLHRQPVGVRASSGRLAHKFVGVDSK